MAGHTVLEQNTDGSYTAPVLPVGSWIRLRVESDRLGLITSVNGVDLPRRSPGAPTWAEPNISVSDGPRDWFEDIVVQLPENLLARRPLRLTVRYADPSVPQGPQNVELEGQDPSVKAGNVFDSGDNSKDSGNPFRVCQYAKTAIVARNVTVAGWLVQAPERNAPGTTTVPHETEDFHYDIVPDPNFFARNYGTLSSLLKPVGDAMIPGHPTPCNPFTSWPHLPLLVGGSFDPNSLLLPGGSSPGSRGSGSALGVELNSWHIPARGNPPSGWIRDPDQANFSGDAWPFNPIQPTVAGVPPRILTAGDYVIVSGTVWEDSSHLAGSPNAWNKCWNDKLNAQAGWLEIHPVDSIRPVDAPSGRLTPHLAAACGPANRTFDDYLFPDTAPNNTSVLRWRRVDDPRFTGGGGTLTETIDAECQRALHVHMTVAPRGYWKAIYYVWWQDSGHVQKRPPGCTPPSRKGRQRRHVGPATIPPARRDETS